MRELKGDWRDLFNGFMVALDLRKCFLALLGIFVTVLLCGGMTILLAEQLDPAAVTVPRDLVLHKWLGAQYDAWHVIYRGAGAPGHEGAVAPNPWIALGYTAAFVVVLLAIWSYFGGAIARIAAFEIAKDGERIETRRALQFSRKKFWSFFWAPLICVIGLLFFYLCNYVGGFVGKLFDLAWIGAPLVALLLPLALLSGFIMILIAVGTVTGLPLFMPAVAAEGTDSFDAVSRGFSYVYSRPWHYVGYQILSAAYGYVCIAFVILFAIAMCHVGLQAGAAGFELSGAWVRKDAQGAPRSEFRDVANDSWALILSDQHREAGRYAWDPVSIAAAPHPYGRLMTAANAIVNVQPPRKERPPTNHVVAGLFTTLWLVITLGLALGYVVSYAVSQQTMIYYILRKKVDGIEMNEVFEEQEEEIKAGEVAAKPGEPAPAAPTAPPPSSEEKKA